MTNENEFYRLLAEVPEVPTDVYDGIDRAIRRRFVVRVRLLSLAASVIFVAGVGTVLFNKVFKHTPLRPEVASELQTVREFLNGNDLESDLELYAVVEGY